MANGNNPISFVDPDGGFSSRKEARQFRRDNDIGGFLNISKTAAGEFAIKDGQTSWYHGEAINYGKASPGAINIPEISITGFRPAQINQVGLGFNGAFTFIGAYGEAGYAYRKGDFFGGSFYTEHGESEGLDASIGLNVTRHYSNNQSFQVQDLQGYSGALQGGVLIFDFGSGGDRVNTRYNDTFNFPGLTYKSKSRGASLSPIPGGATRIKGYTKVY
jgi:hypothetical protein